MINEQQARDILREQRVELDINERSISYVEIAEKLGLIAISQPDLVQPDETLL